MNRLLKKLNGYQKAPRARFKLLSEGRLTQEEFLLYELTIAITDWDSKHETYGTFEATNQEIAELLGWKSDTTVLKHKRNLIKKDIFLIENDGRIKAKGFDKWQLRLSNPSKNKDETVEKQPNILKIEDKASEIKDDRSQDSDYSLVSSKVDLSLKEPLKEDLSDEELIRIISDIDSKRLASESDPHKEFIDHMNLDEQLVMGITVFGEGTKWADET